MNEGNKPNRKRKIRVNFFISEEEKKLIEAKMRLAGYKNMSKFLRQAAVYDKVIVYDFGTIKETNKELNRIGVSINQIAARVNSTDTIYRDDLDFLKKKVEEIWRLQKSILSSLR